jgi:MOSC domain-containing protein
MTGEELEASYVNEGGLLGDRCYALIDRATGKVVSAKNPRRWGKLFEFRASFVDPPTTEKELPGVRITLPDGSSINSEEPGADSLLSEALGAQVMLMTASIEKPSYEEYWPVVEGLTNKERVTDEFMPPYTFFDFGAIHLLTTTTLGLLSELYPEGRFDVRRFRPNVVVEPTAHVKDFVENGWVNRVLHVGEVRLRITKSCTRCVMTTLAQGDLPQDLGILQAVARYNRTSVGAYASVERGGNIKRGDSICLE